MSAPNHPYLDLPDSSFWRSAVADRDYLDLIDLSAPIGIGADDKVATGGSCFAQHIGHHLRQREVHFVDCEPAPPFLSPAEARRHGFGVYSCRYGNIYTARQLLQLAQEALANRQPEDVVWSGNGRLYDALRPSVDPSGHESVERVLALRDRHIGRVRAMFESLDVFIFTLGLTEAWEACADGTVYPTAPGTIAGNYDPGAYRFRNFRHSEIMEDLREFWELLRSVNPTAKLLLTVSPVPLSATASSNHVLVATTYSKSVLRSVAGEVSEEVSDIGYFPSFEIICSHPSRAIFFEEDMRTVTETGVEFVMDHFFRSSQVGSPASERGVEGHGNDLICDDELLDRFAG